MKLTDFITVIDNEFCLRVSAVRTAQTCDLSHIVVIKLDCNEVIGSYNNSGTAVREATKIGHYNNGLCLILNHSVNVYDVCVCGMKF